MQRSIATIIVGPNDAFREAISNSLRPAAFRVVASKPTLIEINSGEIPRSERCLVVVECAESPHLLAAQIAQLKRQNPMVRVALMGKRWQLTDIAAVFQAGANAYFAEATTSEEFLKAIELITR